MSHFVQFHPRRRNEPNRRFCGVCDVTTGVCDDTCSWSDGTGDERKTWWGVTVDRLTGIAYTHHLDWWEYDHPKDYAEPRFTP